MRKCARIEIDLDLDDLVYELNDIEKQYLISIFREDGDIRTSKYDKLSENKHLLTIEEEEIINKIISRFI
jgi:hypothetical protein